MSAKRFQLHQLHTTCPTPDCQEKPAQQYPNHVMVVENFRPNFVFLTSFAIHTTLTHFSVSWVTCSNQILIFYRLLDNFVVTTQALPKELVFKKYVAMCKLQDKDPLLPSMFGKIVHRAFPGLRSSRTGTKGKVGLSLPNVVIPFPSSSLVTQAKHCYKGLSIRTGGNRVDEEDNKEVGTPPSTSQTWTERTSSTEPFRKSNLSSSPSSSSSFPSPEISSPSSSHSSLSTTLHSYDAISTPPNQSDLLDLGQDPFPRRPDISACSGSQGQRLTLPWLYQVVSNPNPNLPDSFYSRSISPSPQRWSSFFPPPYISPLSVPQSELPVERMILWQPFSSPMKKGLDPFADLDQLKYQPSTRPRPP